MRHSPTLHSRKKYILLGHSFETSILPLSWENAAQKMIHPNEQNYTSGYYPQLQIMTHTGYRVALSSTLYHQVRPANLRHGNLIIDEWTLGREGICVCMCVCQDRTRWEVENSISHTEEWRQAGRCAAGRESAWQYPWMKWQDYRGIRKPAEMDDNAVYGKVPCCLQREIQTVSIMKILSSSLKSSHGANLSPGGLRLPSVLTDNDLRH